MVSHLVGVGPRDTDGVEQVFQAVGNRPQVEGHLPRHQCVCVVKQVDVAPGQRTVLLQDPTSQTHPAWGRGSALMEGGKIYSDFLSIGEYGYSLLYANTAFVSFTRKCLISVEAS